MQIVICVIAICGLPALKASVAQLTSSWGFSRVQHVVEFEAEASPGGNRTFDLTAEITDRFPNLAFGRCAPYLPAEHMAAQGASVAGLDATSMVHCEFRSVPGTGLVGVRPVWEVVIASWGIEAPKIVRTGDYFLGVPEAQIFLSDVLFAVAGFGLAWLAGWRGDERGFAKLWTDFPRGAWVLMLPALVGFLVFIAVREQPAAAGTRMPASIELASEGAVGQTSTVKSERLEPSKDVGKADARMPASTELPIDRAVGQAVEAKWERLEASRTASAVGTAIIAPLSEELFYRAGLLSILSKTMSAPAAVLVSSVSFALGHQSDWRRTLSHLAAGLFLGIAWMYTRSLTFCVLAHFLCNLGAALRALAWLA